MLENVSLILKLVLESMGFCKITFGPVADDDVYFLDDREWNLDLHDHVHSQLRGSPFYRPLQRQLRIRVVCPQRLKSTDAKTCIRRMQPRHSRCCFVQI